MEHIVVGNFNLCHERPPCHRGETKDFIMIGWVVPLASNSHYKDDITCLGSGIPN